MPHHPLYDKLREIVGEQNVSDEEYVLIAYSRDVSPLPPHKPDIVVRPKSVDEVVSIIELANETKTPVMATGGRASMCGACLPLKGGIMIDMTRMNKVLDIDEDRLIVETEAGITWANLLYEVEKKGYKLGYRGPYSGHAATVGGSISCNSTGLGGAKWGQAPDGVVSLEVVLPTGEVLETGTAVNPYAKRFARYCFGPDLTGLFLGDHGILGVKTKVALKIYPKPEAVLYGCYGYKDLESCAKAFYQIQRTGLAEDLVILCNRKSIEYILPDAATAFAGIEALFVYIIEAETRKIGEAIKEYLDSIAVKHGGIDLGTMFPEMFWNAKYEMITPLFEWGPEWAGSCHLLETTRIVEATKKSVELFKKYKFDELGIKYIITAMCAGRTVCVFTAHPYFSSLDKKQREVVLKYWEERKREIIKYGGCFYWTGVGLYPIVVELLRKEWWNVLVKIKKALDPNCIMNPGAFKILGDVYEA